MSTCERITLSLPADTVRRLNDFAASERRNRSNAAGVLLDQALAAGGRRLEELEQVAGDAMPARGASVGGAAARAHLAEHRRLGGLIDPTTLEIPQK